MTKSSTSTQVIALLLALVWAVPETSAQAPTRADIINLQNQINALVALENDDRSEIVNLYGLYSELDYIVEYNYNSTLAVLATVSSNLNFLNNAVAAMNTSIAELAEDLFETDEVVSVIGTIVQKLQNNNEIWLNNFRVIKNILQNGLKFRGTVNFGTAVGVGGFTPRPRRQRRPLRSIGVAPRLNKLVTPAAPRRRGRTTPSTRPVKGTGNGAGAVKPINAGSGGRPGRQPK